MRRRSVLMALLPVLLLAGCAGAPAGGSGASSGDRVRVVASTDVWGDIVKQVGGSTVQVDSIITNPSRDPHEYQADPRDQLAVSRAQLVVVNGGGYDDFLSKLIANAPSSTRVLTAVDSSGLNTKPATGSFNEHVWYDLGAVSRIAGTIEQELARIAPQHRASFEAGLQRFQRSVAALQAEEASIRGTAQGRGVAVTEPVPLYMTAALGLTDRTPAAFSKAIEQGGDVAPAVLQQQLALFSGKPVALLAYNEQTTTPTTDQVVKAAKAAGVPVVGVRETLPTGQDYLQWMRSDLDAMRAALSR